MIQGIAGKSTFNIVFLLKLFFKMAILSAYHPNIFETI